MDVREVISDFKTLDSTRTVTLKEFTSHIRRYPLYALYLVLMCVMLTLIFRQNMVGLLMGLLIVAIGASIYAAEKEKQKVSTQFARIHGLRWDKKQRGAFLHNQGVVFGVGHSPYVLDSFIADSQTLTYGAFTYKFTTGHGKNQSDHYYTVGYYDLPKELPHILLDSKKNDGLLNSSIPRMLNKDYRVSLEGDFDQHFTLYTAFPKPAEALTILSPDVMSTLIDVVPEVDIEIVDKRLWVYLPNKRSYHGYAQVLEAGMLVLQSAQRNLHHYRMEDVTQLDSQVTNRQKLESNNYLLLGVVVIIFAVAIGMFYFFLTSLT